MLNHGSMWLVHKKMLLNTFMYYFGIFLFFITKFVFLSFSFLFLIKYQISATEYQPIRNVNWWFPTVSETVCKIPIKYWFRLNTDENGFCDDFWPLNNPLIHKLCVFVKSAVVNNFFSLLRDIFCINDLIAFVFVL